jgi:hypothetical protein
MAHLLVSAHQSALAHPAFASQHRPTQGLSPSSGRPSRCRPSGHATTSRAVNGRPPALGWSRTEAPPDRLHSPALARSPSTPSPFPLSSFLLRTSKCHPTELFALLPSITAASPTQSPHHPTPPGVRTPLSSSPSP